MGPVLRPRGTAPVQRPAAEASCEKVVSCATPKHVLLRAPCGEEPIARALPSDASVGLEVGDGAELQQGEGDTDSAADAPQDQGGSWSTVDRQGAGRQPAPVTGSKRPRIKLGCTTGYANHYLAVLALQRDLQGLQMDVRPNLKGEYVLTPKDDAATDRMCGLVQERDAPARLVLLDPAERHTKAVLQRYPHDMPLEAVRDHPSVISAWRLRAVRDRAPTRQVLVELIGAAPDGLDRGPFGGKYSLRHYKGGAPAVYRCQRYNPPARALSTPRQVWRGAARRTHPSSASGVIRPGSSRPPMPNCFGGHHAWNPRCPERLRRLPGGGRCLQGGGDRPGPKRFSFVPAPPPTKPAWGGGALDTYAEGSRGLASLFHIRHPILPGDCGPR
ncbi:hypothetical protein GWK47_045677 [Chionoecetes opilio]|uniref:Uncharacterized protein n=1 Tax=Chionoecetes opilio TaxID=41210 RepID=A0A8J4Y6X4_CHIOP|nr:hypothetical protein GWK47_045677 [Chionoecetes opilio]